MVHGESQSYAAAIVSPTGDDIDDATLARGITAANARLPEYAQVRRWLRASEPFSFDNGLLTSNGRLRRAAILQRYDGKLDALYRDETDS
jgi:long-subunit acyl-CoA synthetase (AMP-forming)